MLGRDSTVGFGHQPRDLSSYLELLAVFEIRRPTDAWIKFHVRRAAESGFWVDVRRRGDARRGSVVIKYNLDHNHAKVLTMVRAANGTTTWLPVHGKTMVADRQAERYLERIARTDPDIWILIVDREKPQFPLSETGGPGVPSRTFA